MYSREERMRAIRLYIKCNKSASDAIRELGYPDRKTLRVWYRNYLNEQKTGVSHDKYIRIPKYTKEQKETAVRYYFEHGCCYSKTVRILGYPNRETLRQWCCEIAPDKCKKRIGSIRYAPEQKKEDRIASCQGESNIKCIAHGQRVNESNLSILPNKEAIADMCTEDERTKDKDELLSEIKTLQKQIQRLKLERDVLAKAAEIIKKDPGINLKNLTNKEKAILVDAVRGQHLLHDIIGYVGIKRSTYFYHRASFLSKDKFQKLIAKIKELFHASGGCYGYRRIHALLVRGGTRVSEKIVRRIMRESTLIVFSRKNRKYSSYQGEKTPAAPNLIERDFHADAPNTKWLTDITEFQIPAGKVYLSPIVDCFDGMLVSWAIGTNPNAGLVNTMLKTAISALKPDEHPIVHSDRGAHYRWPGWLKLMKDKGLLRSMSKKGCTPDNAACEGVFGRIKNEMYHNRTWSGVSIEEFMEILNSYLYWYNEKRIKMSLGALSPLEYRERLNLTAA